VKFISPAILSDSVRELLSVWKNGELTDVVMTKDKIGAYMKEEVINLDSFSEDEFISFVQQTIPVKYEKEWGEIITKGNIVKYSFGISGCCVVRASLWSEGVVMRFIPLNPFKIVKENDLVPTRSKRFFHIERGGKCSGKTTRIFAQVLDFCKRHKGAVVFTYERPQEIYVGDETSNVISISKDDISIEEFADLVISSSSSLCIVQHASEKDIEVLRYVYDCGVNVIAEVRGTLEGGESCERNP